MESGSFQALKTKSITWRHDHPKDRISRLHRVKTWMKQNQNDIQKALYNDFKKPTFETDISEILPTLSELKHITAELDLWMSDKKVPTPLTLLGHASWIRFENKGVVLVIAPWNYPFQLAVIPLITALAAGNTVVLKPSELTPHTANLLVRLVKDCFAENEVMIETGDKDKTTELLSYDFDHVFFTGSTAVGKIIAKACAERLIPMTLELGGKSPTIVDETADLELTSEKIFWGKYLNRGQTCVAPDYIIVHESIAADLTTRLKKLAVTHKLDEQGGIISKDHAERLQNLANVAANSTLDILSQPELTSRAMQEEIFGPVLPILTYRTETELFELVRKYEKPLSLYIFSKNKKFINSVLNELPSGGVGINSVLVHLANHHLPFGGVGASGQGRYHGHFGFLELSHQRAVIKQSYFGFLRKLMQPPYSDWKKKLLKYL
ncbi:MAG: aldehyde dehydrogenase family protein [Bdellovibrio sp.]|nr:aldehyde dehydrogenase family protein [Bdellovibrio sp.]